MITLATLHSATAQEVFDQVALHLLTQDSRSININGTCMYRGPDGLKCAVGSLIAEEEYQDCFEWKDYGELIEQGMITVSRHQDLIAALQACHDTSDPFYWASHLQRIANNHNLNTNAIEPWITTQSSQNHAQLAPTSTMNLE